MRMHWTKKSLLATLSLRYFQACAVLLNRQHTSLEITDQPSSIFVSGFNEVHLISQDQSLDGGTTSPKGRQLIKENFKNDRTDHCPHLVHRFKVFVNGMNQVDYCCLSLQVSFMWYSMFSSLATFIVGIIVSEIVRYSIVDERYKRVDPLLLATFLR